MHSTIHPVSRRAFMQRLGLVALSMPALSYSFAASTQSSSGRSSAHSQEEIPEMSTNPARKLGVALVGLGGYSANQLGPALKETKLCELRGIVTGSPDKAKKWKKEYALNDKNIYNYSNFDQIRDNPDIDIVYVVLPNSMHAEYTVRAAQAGKHVICEKPMAITVNEGEQMIDACKKADRLLSIGYRLHFDPYNLQMMRYREDATFGTITKVYAKDGFKIEPNVWRLNRKLAGGGPLMDLGIYCVQGALYTIGTLPIAVTAQEGRKTDLEKFKDVEQSISWQLEFPHGVVAECDCSYEQEMNLLRAEADKGWFALEPAYEYKKLKGANSKGEIMKFPQVNQQALQMDDFAQCVLTKSKSRVPGEMGLRDVKILTAIYESARTGKKITLEHLG